VAKLHLAADNLGRPCHELDGKRVQANDVVELRLSAGRWLRCQYRWNGDPDSQPVFTIVLGGEWEQRELGAPSGDAPEAVIRAELADAELRWPSLD
jgi:hypothetical protein